MLRANLFNSSMHNITVADGCKEAYKRETDFLEALNEAFCETVQDGFGSCWPPTSAEQWATNECPEEYFSQYFLTMGTCRRFCYANGTWHPKADYSNCTVVTPLLTDLPQFNVYLGTYILSVIALLIGIFILQYFKPLRCVRNSIHSHFMLSILIRAIVWLGSAVVVVYYPEMDRLGNLLVIFRVFILVAVYSWMLVEGIYLFSLLFWTLTAQHFRFYGFFAIGWGIPGVLSIGYAITKLSKKGCPKWDDPTLYEPEGTAVLGSILCMLAINLIITTITIYTLLTNVQRRSTGCRHAGGSAASRSGSNRLIGEVVFNYVRAPKRFGSTANQTRSKESCLVNKTGTEDDTQSEERFNRVSGADWSSDDRAARSTLSSGTVQPRHELLEFLKKHGLRSSSKTPRSKTWKNNSLEPWKALKAILVLMPILGYPQLIFLRPYFQNFEMVFEYINAIIIGTQGFWVSVIYCFWNSEVQRLMGLRWRQWKRNSRMSKHLQAHKKLSQSQPGEDKLATTTPSATPNKCEVLCTAE